MAAERAFWLLAQHNADPLAAHLPDGTDPASVLHAHGPAALLDLLDKASPPRRDAHRRTTHQPARQRRRPGGSQRHRSQPPDVLGGKANTVHSRTKTPLETITGHLRTAATRWNSAPAEMASEHLAESAAIQARLQARTQDPAKRWASLAEAVHPGLSSPDVTGRHSHKSSSRWPTTDLDVAHETRAAADRRPLSDQPAQDLRYRLVGLLPPPAHDDPAHDRPTAPGLPSHRQQPPSMRRSARLSPRPNR